MCVLREAGSIKPVGAPICGKPPFMRSQLGKQRLSGAPKEGALEGPKEGWRARRTADRNDNGHETEASCPRR